MYDKGAFSGLRQRSGPSISTTRRWRSRAWTRTRDGKYDREELAELAKVNIDGLKEFAYFTTGVGCRPGDQVRAPSDYWLEHRDGALSLNFTLPFAEPVSTGY